MAKVVWARRDDIKNAKQTIAPKVMTSGKDFRPPATIEDDFRRLLEHDVPHVNFTFELVRDWYDIFEDDYEPFYIRAQQTPIDWKSKIGNSDMSVNFKVTHDIPIHKGDMVIREDGTVFLQNWNVQNHANNQATQTIECNATIDVIRRVPDQVNAEGYLVEEGGIAQIAPAIPVMHEEYAGRPDYSSAQGQPGMTPDHLITVSFQWNSHTKHIDLNDEFTIGTFTYRVINVSIAEVNIDKDYGVQKVNAKRVAGGGITDDQL